MKLWGILFGVLFALSAQADKTQILSDLKTLYPYLSSEQLKTKIQLADNPDKFLRSFGAYYFLALKKQPNLVGRLITLGREAGWCVGDAHYSNFGAVLDGNGKSIFTINDLDDGGPCPLISDFLKFLTSTALKKPNQDLFDFVRAYKFILQGAQWSLSQESLALLEKSQKLGTTIDPDLLESPKKLKRDKNARELTEVEKSEALKAVGLAYGAADVLDMFATFKDGGGSHGLLRFKVLMDSNGARRLIQFKQLVDPAVMPLVVGPLPIPPERIKNTLKVEQGENFSTYYNVQKVNSMAMLLEPLYWGNTSPSDFSRAIALDEAKALAYIHKKTASDSYSNQSLSIPDGDWVLAAKNLAAFINDVHRTINQ